MARTADHVVRTEPDGSRVFVKRMRPIADVSTHANVEAEVLAPLLLAGAGLPALPVTTVFDAVARTWTVVMPFVEQTDATSDDRTSPGELHVGDDVLARLALVDVLIGNADRQPRNVLVAAGRGCVPIDHDVAFLAPDATTRAIGLVGFVPGFDGVAPGRGDNGYRRWLLSRCGTLEHLLGSSPLYRRFRRRALNEARRRALLDAAKIVRESMSDGRIDAALALVPDAVIEGDPGARKQHIRRTLRLRRDALPEALARHQSAH